jgi:hypothetical protein
MTQTDCFLRGFGGRKRDGFRTGPIKGHHDNLIERLTVLASLQIFPEHVDSGGREKSLKFLLGGSNGGWMKSGCLAGINGKTPALGSRLERNTYYEQRCSNNRRHWLSPYSRQGDT